MVESKRVGIAQKLLVAENRACWIQVDGGYLRKNAKTPMCSAHSLMLINGRVVFFFSYIAVRSADNVTHNELCVNHYVSNKVNLTPTNVR